MNARKIDYRNITLLNHAPLSSSKDSNGVDQAPILEENKWIDNDLQLTTANLNWKQREIIKALKGKHDRQEFKRSNMCFEPCLPSKQAYSFGNEKFFMFYGIVVEKTKAKPTFNLFQWLILRRLRLAPSQLGPKAWLILVYFKYVCTYLGGL